MKIAPITLAAANEFIQAHHRHHKKTQGWKFGVALESGGQVVGVGIAGRPVARMLDDGKTLEVTRCCTLEQPNACSRIYSALWRAAKELGYRRMITYTLETEPGTSLRACSWRRVGEAGGGTWSRPSRGRVDKHPLVGKVRWEIEVQE